MVTTGCGIKSETKDLNTILLLYYNERNENKEKDYEDRFKFRRSY